LSWATFSASSKIFSVEISGSARENLTYARHGKRNATDVFRAEVDVDVEQVLYRLALHAQSLSTAAAWVGRRDELVLPDGDRSMGPPPLSSLAFPASEIENTSKIA
jgi:hypothetical protein